MNKLKSLVSIAISALLSITLAFNFTLPAVASPAQQSTSLFDDSYGTLVAYAQDIVTTAVEAGQFNTLAAALQAAGLVEVLQSSGPFTVFAPTDAAFADLPPGLVEDLLRPENKDTLIKILTYHVVPGKVLSGDLVSGKVGTLEGDDIDVQVSYAGVKVDEANVIIPDVPATNGVIHVIDSVLIPGF
ncbi:MAG: fasciclin domain-containing protein [Cyanothece sp. SIO2G6]|nr:fasciclin domain-containing protein [Cyanothece sp. SIO2G6]